MSRVRGVSGDAMDGGGVAGVLSSLLLVFCMSCCGDFGAGSDAAPVAASSGSSPSIVPLPIENRLSAVDLGLKPKADVGAAGAAGAELKSNLELADEVSMP